MNDRPHSPLASATGDVAELSRQTGKRWLFFLYRFLLRLFPLAEPPREEDLRADLYVMF